VTPVNGDYLRKVATESFGSVEMQQETVTEVLELIGGLDVSELGVVVEVLIAAMKKINDDYEYGPDYRDATPVHELVSVSDILSRVTSDKKDNVVVLRPK
jgi:hypothetical protein